MYTKHETNVSLVFLLNVELSCITTLITGKTRVMFRFNNKTITDSKLNDAWFSVLLVHPLTKSEKIILSTLQ